MTFLHSPNGVPNTILHKNTGNCATLSISVYLWLHILGMKNDLHIRMPSVCAIFYDFILGDCSDSQYAHEAFRLSTSVSNMKYYIRFTAYRTTQWSTSEVIVPCRIRFPALKQFPNELHYWHCTVKRRQTWQSETINLILIFCVLPYENNSRQLSLRFPDSRLLKKPAPKSSWKSL